MVQNESEIWFFEAIERFVHCVFIFYIWYVMKIYLICYVLVQIWEKSGSCDAGRNALSQSDYRIFQSTISPERNDEIALFFYVRKNS